MGFGLASGDVEDDGSVGGLVALGASGGVEESGGSVGGDAVAFVNVSEDVEARADSALDGVEEVETAGAGSVAGQVSVPERRSVGDEDVELVGDGVPVAQDLLSAFDVEGPAAEGRLPGTPVETKAAQFDQSILQVGTAPQNI